MDWSILAGLGGSLLSGLLGASAQSDAQRQQMAIWQQMMARQRQEETRHRSREEQHERRFTSPMLNQMQMRASGLYGADPTYQAMLMQHQQQQQAQSQQLANLQAATGAVTNPHAQQYQANRQNEAFRAGMGGLMAQQRQQDMGYIQNRGQGLAQATQGAYGGLMGLMGQQPVNVSPLTMAGSQFFGGAGSALQSYFGGIEADRRLQAMIDSFATRMAANRGAYNMHNMGGTGGLIGARNNHGLYSAFTRPGSVGWRPWQPTL